MHRIRPQIQRSRQGDIVEKEGELNRKQGKGLGNFFPLFVATKKNNKSLEKQNVDDWNSDKDTAEY